MKLLSYKLGDWQAYGSNNKFWNYWRQTGAPQYIMIGIGSINEKIEYCRFYCYGINDLPLEKMFKEMYGDQQFSYEPEEIERAKKQVDEFIERINQMKSFI